MGPTSRLQTFSSRLSREAGFCVLWCVLGRWQQSTQVETSSERQKNKKCGHLLLDGRELTPVRWKKEAAKPRKVKINCMTEVSWQVWQWECQVRIYNRGESLFQTNRDPGERWYSVEPCKPRPSPWSHADVHAVDCTVRRASKSSEGNVAQIYQEKKKKILV